MMSPCDFQSEQISSSCAIVDESGLGLTLLFRAKYKKYFHPFVPEAAKSRATVARNVLYYGKYEKQQA